MRNNIKRLFYTATVITAMVITAACGGTSVIDDFESGSLEQWVVDGNAFLQKASDSVVNPEVKGYKGEYYVSNKNNGTAVQGSLTSYSFTIDKNYINFLMGGTISGEAYAELLIDGESVLKSSPYSREQNTLTWRSWDVKEYKGRTANIRIFAKYDGAGHGIIMVDQIEMGNKAKSGYLEEYTVAMTASRKWLLIPAQDTGARSKLTVMSDGVNLLGVEQDVFLAREKVDYYIPVDIEKYAGMDIQVVLTGVDKSDKAYNNITQTDDFSFDYDEAYRQLYHMTPWFGWTNDPNGLVYFDGEYHVAFQSNPYGIRHANMHWGNALSKDLVNWENLPFIIAPDELGSVFSGSSVVDVNNTAGFGENAIVAIYTSAGGDNYSIQQQSMAYSLDRGRTYTKYDNNPVLFDPALQPDFRDPKVAWIGDKWVMSLATGQTITFYGSKNLKDWEKLSDFGYGIGSHDGVWECPDLLKFSYNGQEKWVLLVSINPGGPHGGSVTQYFIGQFDGKTFKADPMDYPLWLDAGADNYAGVTFGNTGDRHIFLGWMSNWLYSNDTPTLNFRNSMTIPRELYLKHDGRKMIVASKPSPEIYAAFGLANEREAINVNSIYDIEEILPGNKGAYKIDMTLTPDAKGRFGFRLMNGNGEHSDFIFDAANATISLDRSGSGQVDFNNQFAAKPITSPIVVKDSYKIELFVDKMSAELFLNDGDLVFTNTMFPTEVYNKIQLFAEDCSVAVSDIKIYELK